MTVKSHSINLVLVVAVFGCFVVGCGFLPSSSGSSTDYSTTSASLLTAETSGQIVSVALNSETSTSRRPRRNGTSRRPQRETKRTTNNTVIEYNYTVDGKTVESSTEKSGDQRNAFLAGTSVVVCYNPTQPDDSEIYKTGHVCDPSGVSKPNSTSAPSTSSSVNSSAYQVDPTLKATSRPCSEEGNVKSPISGEMSVVIFDNKRSGAVSIYWLDYEGKRQKYFDVKPGERLSQKSLKSHWWLIVDADDGRCMKIVMAPVNVNITDD